MKRDMDLIRAILLKAESWQSLQPCKIEIPEHSREELFFHAKLAKEAGFIEAAFMNPCDFVVLRLTWDGHEFIDLARQDTNWNEAKETAGKAGAFSLETLKAILVKLAEVSTEAVMRHHGL